MKNKLYLLIISLIVLLTSCDPFEFYFYRDDYFEIIDAIELIKYNNDNFKIVNASKIDLKFEPSKVEKIEILDKKIIIIF